ncbi:MAG TPA: FtsX-like permease family protein, partial [Cyclobacteriaceae bacterium]|nr:FtsX-like permease family protein [Cyclobacteriaceae bacterium]
DVFTYSAVEGDLLTALDEPNSIVLTEHAAEKYFGKEHGIVGKTLSISGSWWTNGDYKVTAVIKNVPSTSHFKFDFLINTYHLLQNDFYKASNGTSTEGNFVTYIELDRNTDIKEVQDKMPRFVEKYQGQELKEIEGKATLLLQPITDIHLMPGYNLEMSPTINVNTLYFFVVVSILIILLAWINYINLSTAGATERRKEVGIKKTIGAYRRQLVAQFMAESFLTHFISAILAIYVAYLLLPALGEILDKELSLDFHSRTLWISMLVFIFIGSFIAGAYPSFILSSFKPITALTGINDKASQPFTLRQVLVVFQFSISIIILASMFVVTRQLGFMQNRNKGFNSEKMLIVKGPGLTSEMGSDSKLLFLKSQLKNLAYVENVASSDAIPGAGYNWGTGMRKNRTGIEENKNGEVVFVDPDFINTYGMNLLSGNGWDIEKPDQKQSILINERALRTFGFDDDGHAVGEKLIIGNDTFEIHGVLKDYHWSSLKSPIAPYVLASNEICGKYLSIHLQNADLKEAIFQIERLYSTTFPDKPFEYYFLDEFFNRQYKADQQFHRVVSLSALLSIIIASLGLWGLASFTIEQKTKEISIRKVLGASSQNILLLLSRGFLKLIIIASVITLPIIIYGINKWLDNFAYKIDLSLDLYIFPIATLTLIAISTVASSTIKATLINPSDHLKTE